MGSVFYPPNSIAFFSSKWNFPCVLLSAFPLFFYYSHWKLMIHFTTHPKKPLRINATLQNNSEIEKNQTRKQAHIYNKYSDKYECWSRVMETPGNWAFLGDFYGLYLLSQWKKRKFVYTRTKGSIVFTWPTSLKFRDAGKWISEDTLFFVQFPPLSKKQVYQEMVHFLCYSGGFTLILLVFRGGQID